MNWEEACADPVLRDLPYKIELNKYGYIIMSPPPSNEHGEYQVRISYRLLRSMETLSISGKVTSECSIDTADGTKVADVAWCSSKTYMLREIGRTYKMAPEVCVEIRSPSNSKREMEEKKDLYFEAGAKEFWLCDKDGRMAFFDHEEGELKASKLFPTFPHVIET